MQITVDFDIDSFEELTRAERAALNRAKNKAVRDTLFKLRDSVRGQIKQNFNNPKRYVVNGVMVRTPAKIGKQENLIGELYVNDYPSRAGTPANEILYPHIHLGPRVDKRGEKRLRQVGVLPAGLQVVPTEDYRDARGSIKPGLMTKILSDINAFPEYMTMNRINTGNIQAYKRSRIKKARFFVVKPGGKNNPGIYEFIGKGTARRMKMVLAFVKIRYGRKRIFFYEAANKAFSPRVFGVTFNHFAKIYTRSGSPDFARFVRAQKRFRTKVSMAKAGVSEFGPRLPMRSVPGMNRSAAVGGGLFRR